MGSEHETILLPCHAAHAHVRYACARVTVEYQRSTLEMSTLEMTRLEISTLEIARLEMSDLEMKSFREFGVALLGHRRISLTIVCYSTQAIVQLSCEP